MKILLIATNRHGRYMNDIQAQPLPIGLDYIVGLHRWLTSLAYIAGYLDREQHSTKMLDLVCR